LKEVAVMRKLFIIALAVSVLCVLLAAQASAEEAKKVDVKKPAIPAGQSVFTEAKCQMCHTVYSAGIGEPPAADEKTEAVENDGPPDLSMAGAGRTAEWLSLFLQKKEMLHEKTHMKRFKGSDEDLTALVDWLLTLKPVEKEAPKTEKAGAAVQDKAAEGAAAEKGDSCEDHGNGDKADTDAGAEDKKGE
jgi:cbb3-type cytochrome oxidase cytochrome c subunit